MIQRAGGSNSGNQNGGAKDDQVVDFTAVREKRLDDKRKNTERIFFRDLLSVYSVTGHSKMLPVELIDVSEDGCAFQIPYDPNNLWPNQDDGVPIRLYFSREMYMEIFVRIQNSRHSIEGNHRFLRFGCSVDKGTQSYPAYQQFVKFLKLYSEQAHKDTGDMTLFYL